jgi:hypothetical protein
MVTEYRLALTIITALPLCSLAGCPQKHKAADPLHDAGVEDAATKDATSIAITVPRNPLGTTCATNKDCTSGYCTDGVCCDSACGQQCFSCNSTGNVGNCAPQTQGQDETATVPCTGTNICVLDPATSLPACKLADLQTCSANTDCASAACLTFFLDADGDGYGTPTQARVCTEQGAAPPPGYALLTGDCCDIDSGANPGVPADTYFEFSDACGSFDWNCNGIVDQQQQCPGDPTLACGATCIVNLGLGPFTIFTQACH